MEKTYRGTIVFIQSARGYGFISQDNEDGIKDGGKGLFFHSTNICNEEFANLRKGTEVEYMITETKKGPEAIGVVVR